MNIKEAKDEIKRSVEIYLDKNEFGDYTIPVSKQRPIFMVGTPGIGKTEMIRQIASELDIAFVSCSMTCHTQQSVLGRPVIESRDYDGKKAVVSEYTMSEIIAAVYHVMQDSGRKEGILFLNEIDCVSETLAPAMLLFMQYKTFGNQQLPEGWVVVTAGSPIRRTLSAACHACSCRAGRSRPIRYHKPVTESDIAAVDRWKRIDISEDFSVWKQYAYHQGVHAAVMAFLELNQKWFYSIRFTVDGMQYVTARGWEDLSTAMRLYEKKGFPIDQKLIGQYITDVEIAEKFGIYYDLYRKYRADDKMEDILSGKASGEIVEKLQKAKMEERCSVLGMIMEMLGEGFRKAASREHSLQMTEKALRSVRQVIKEDKIPVSILVQEQAERIQKQLRERTSANSIMRREKEEYLMVLQMLEEYRNNPDTADLKKDFEKIKKQFEREVKMHEKQIEQVKSMLEAAFAFIEKVWGDHHEMAFFKTELKIGSDSRAFIDQWGCGSYFRYEQES